MACSFQQLQHLVLSRMNALGTDLHLDNDIDTALGLGLFEDFCRNPTPDLPPGGEATGHRQRYEKEPSASKVNSSFALATFRIRHSALQHSFSTQPPPNYSYSLCLCTYRPPFSSGRMTFTRAFWEIMWYGATSSISRWKNPEPRL